MLSAGNIFGNSLDPDQAWQNVRPDLDPNYLTLWWYPCKNFLENVDFEKNPQTIRSMKKLPSMQRVNTKLQLKCYLLVSFVENICFNNVIDWFSPYMQTVWTQIRLLHVWQSGLVPLQFGKEQMAKQMTWAKTCNESVKNTSVFCKPYRVRTGLKSTWICRTVLKSPWKLNLPWKVLEKHSKALKSPWILPFTGGFNTFGDLNQYKIVVPLFGAAYAAPNTGTTILY